MRRTSNQLNTEHFKTLTGERRIEVRTIRSPSEPQKTKIHLILGTEANE